MTKQMELETRYQSKLEEWRLKLMKELPSSPPPTTCSRTTGDDDADDAAVANTTLSSDALDDLLVRYVMLYQATPKGLAKDVYQDAEQEKFIEQILLNEKDASMTNLLKEMLRADGPKEQHYGKAMQIYHDIVETSEHMNQEATGVLKRLALAIALEHATPLMQDNPKTTPAESEAFVDPIRRYLNYEMAYMQGELDANFDLVSAWELRFVVDGTEPDEVSQWGRDMLRNYRPDHVLSQNDVWRYVEMVRSNIRYGSQDVKYDREDLQLYQNILLNGGICGRRAFFGRFILRAFGVPTTARPSKGHGALCHWTPYKRDNKGGWFVNLGPDWRAGYTKTVYKADLDFLATTKARVNLEEYWKVKRAQWIGDLFREMPYMGDKQVEEDKNLKLGFWYGLSLKVQQQIIDGLPKLQLPRINKKLHKPTLAEKVKAKPALAEAKQIKYGTEEEPDVIVIPSAAFSFPNKSTNDVQIMQSFHPIQGGLQIYLPSFPSQGVTIVRGGTWKMDPHACSSGSRLKSGGYGKYADWGMRVALSGPEDGSIPKQSSMSIDLTVDGSVAMEMVFVPPGSFVMGGNPNKKDGRFECVETPKHNVTLTRGFWLGKYPVTQQEYQVIMGNNPSKSTKDPNCPVDTIGDSDAFDYCDKLVEVIGRDFRLPTEAEWEYAARGGEGDTTWFFGNGSEQLGDYAWFKDNSGGKSHPVGLKKPNPFGLYDIYGNVFERVSDKYSIDYYEKSPEVDPTGPSQGTKSILEYKVKAPTAAHYSLEVEVVTANPNQNLKVIVNGDESSELTLELPWTNGYWQDTSTPCRLSLKQGENTLRFWRDNPPQYGIAVKFFTLQAVTPS